MKEISVYIIISLLSLSIFACTSEKVKEETSDSNLNTGKIEVYYFHYSHRCKTCVAVEEVTQDALKKLYSKKVKSGIIEFISIDMDEKSGEDLAKKMKVSGQTLLFVQGDKRTNLTNDAFMFAATNPDKLKAKIKVAVDNMLK